MATWAVCLCAVFFLPVLVIAGAGLAIAVLARSSRSRLDHGRGMAVGALAMAGAWVVLGGALLVFVVNGTATDSDSQVGADGAETGPVTLMQGQCFNAPNVPARLGPDEAALANDIDLVSCLDRHRFEAFHVFDLPEDDDFPGDDAVAAAAQERCAAAFDDFIGVAFERSRLLVSFHLPTMSSWQLGDREVSCVVQDPRGPIRDTLRDAGR